MGGGKPSVGDERFDRLPGCECVAVLQQDVLVVAHFNIIIDRNIIDTNQPKSRLPGRLWTGARQGGFVGGLSGSIKLKCRTTSVDNR